MSQYYFSCPCCGKEYDIVTKKPVKSLVFDCIECENEIQYTRKKIVLRKKIIKFPDRDLPISNDDAMNIRISLEVGDFWEQYIN